MKVESRKTLIILSPGFPSDENDSTCIPPQQGFAAALKRLYPSLEIIVIAFQYPFRNGRYSWKGVHVIPLNGRNKGKFRRILIWLKAARILKGLSKEKNIVGLLSFWCTECALVAARFARRHQLKHYCWILGQDALPGNKMVKYIKPQAEELIALSDFVQQNFFINYGLKPKYVIPCAIDRDIFHLEKKERTIDVLGVGSLIPLKQYGIFIEVMRYLKQQLPLLRAMICGKGPEHESLKRMINESGLSENVLLVGEKPHAQILNLMQDTKVLLHPSSYEGFGAVCLEALYAGAHVVSFVQPMYSPIEHWHIVKTKDEMKATLQKLLTATSLSHDSIFPFSIESSTSDMMRLFNYE